MNLLTNYVLSAVNTVKVVKGDNYVCRQRSH